MELKHDFTFVCNGCGSLLEKDVSPFDDDMNRIYDTECCGEGMQRVFINAKSFNVNGGVYHHTKYSDSMAVSMSQIAEHREKFPDVKIDGQGRPGFDSVKQQDEYLNICGFVKHPQKIRKIEQLS